MAKYIRYAVASVCFAASVACLALWGWSLSHAGMLTGPTYLSSQHSLFAETVGGTGRITLSRVTRNWLVTSHVVGPAELRPIEDFKQEYGEFGAVGIVVHFPLWYPALIFALAGVGVLRFRRQFSIRSALICFTVVATLLGMAVVL